MLNPLHVNECVILHTLDEVASITVARFLPLNTFFFSAIDLYPNTSSLACFVYWKVAEQFPVMLRQWYLSLQRQDANEIQRCVLH